MTCKQQETILNTSHLRANFLEKYAEPPLPVAWFPSSCILRTFRMRALKQLDEESLKKLEILQKVFTLTGGGKVDASTKAERKQE